MKKNFFAGLFLLAVLIISGCSQKKEVQTVRNIKAQEFAFDILYYDLTGNVLNKKNKSFAQNIKLSPEIKKILLQKVVVNKAGYTSVLYLTEYLYPECSGFIDSYGFYVPEADNGRWVDKTVFQVQENLVGSQITELLELNPVVQEMLQEEEAIKEGKEVETEVSVEKILLDSNNRLKVMLFEKEIFIPQIKKDRRVFIHTDLKTNKVTRFFYNESFELYKKEVWKIPNADEAKMLFSEEYIYGNDNSIREKIITEDNTVVHTWYTTETLVEKTIVEQKKTITINSDKSNKDESIEKSWFWQKSETKWTYNSEGKITSEILTEYEEPETETNKTKTAFVKKQLFIYNNMEQELPPDYEYYENDVLKNQIVYSAKGNYISKVFFDGDFAVTTYYENNKKIKDVYSVGGIVRRVKTYE